MTTVVVLGASGMLGRAVVSAFPHEEVIALSRPQADITNRALLEEAIPERALVVNAAAYTAVDDAESHSAEAFAINAEGVRNVAEAVKAHNGRLIHISTDYVFDGQGTEPYREDSPRNPQSVYGASKARGEEYVQEILPDTGIVARTAWLYGTTGNSFAHTILGLGATRETLDVVDDQVGQPTSAIDVARMVHSLAQRGVTNGVFHATNSGQASWFEFAQDLFALAGWETDRIRPVASHVFPRPAQRPAWSVLAHDAWTAHNIAPPRHWKEALQETWDLGLKDVVQRS